MTSRYSISSSSAIRNAAAPMIGGMIWPPVEATASMAPATGREYPPLRISGMVRTPVDATLETALPEMEPNKPEATTAILAEPPRVPPMAADDISVMNVDPPDRRSA